MQLSTNENVFHNRLLNVFSCSTVPSCVLVKARYSLRLRSERMCFRVPPFMARSSQRLVSWDSLAQGTHFVRPCGGSCAVNALSRFGRPAQHLLLLASSAHVQPHSVRRMCNESLDDSDCANNWDSARQGLTGRCCTQSVQAMSLRRFSQKTGSTNSAGGRGVSSAGPETLREAGLCRRRRCARIW